MDDEKEKLRNVKTLEFHLINSKRNLLIGFLFSFIIGLFFSDYSFKFEAISLLVLFIVLSWFLFEKQLKLLIENVKNL